MNSTNREAIPLKITQATLAVIFAAFPLLGVFLWGWSAREVILLYWAENLIIGFWQVLRMLSTSTSPFPGRLFLSAFFTFHYGFFCFGHGIFLLVLTQGDFSELTGGPAFLYREALDAVTRGTLLAIASNFFMNGVRFVREHLIGRQYLTKGLSELMREPYKHIIVVHLAILAAGFVTMLVPAALPLLALIVVGKLILDLRSIFAPPEPRGARQFPS